MSALLSRAEPEYTGFHAASTYEAQPHHRPGRVAIVLGTRPEIIKLAEFILLLGSRARVIHTGQHYDDNLSTTFFRGFGLAPPAVTLGVGGGLRGAQIGEAVSQLTHHLHSEPASAVVVQGDTTTALAGALAANALETPLVHVEAGLRSHDRMMPEEHNRVVVDHLADLCCAPTNESFANLAFEGIPAHRIAVTGNTVVEAVRRLLPPPQHRAALLQSHGLEPRRYLVATFHRPENVDNPDRLAQILRELRILPLPVVLPLHPRTAGRIAAAGLTSLLKGLRIIDPVPYAEFLTLAAEAACLVSDSGGIQEEASVLKRPVAVVRASTERPEVLGTFSELVTVGPAIGRTVGAWLDDLDNLHARLEATPSPYGDGAASGHCITALDALLARTTRLTRG